jgi:2-oxoglutarate ferredoxin oxidoreductase subunit gamma
MIDEVLIAGFGGQGIMLMGKLLAYGAIYEGLEVTFYPSYGPEMRGGTANCTVVVSDQRIGSPVRNHFSHLMAMNQASVDKFSERVKPGGVIAYNQSLVASPPARTDVMRVAIPANRIALELNAPQSANMRVLPQYRHDAIALNQTAIQRGIEAVKQVLAAEEGA